MYGLMRMKRVTDPLDDKVKARIVGRDRSELGYVSSGSEHSAHGYDDVTSPSLSELFFGFGDGDGDSSPESCNSDFETEPSTYDSTCRNADLINQIVEDRTDEFRNVLTAHVLNAVQIYSCVRSDKSILRRNVMAFLRNCGYNAAVCKTKWPSSGGLTAGNYEFVDILTADPSPARYLVDLDFAAEFDIARPTCSYERLQQLLPRVFVGRIDDLKQILKVASDCAKRSLKSRGLHLPPWRKHRFMQNKWFGPYRRTTNAITASFSPQAPVSRSYAVECRAVGFDAAGDGGCLLIPAAARTR